jgi:hypothetical protein
LMVFVSEKKKKYSKIFRFSVKPAREREKK